MKRFLPWVLVVSCLSCSSHMPDLVVPSRPFPAAGKLILVENFSFDSRIATEVNPDHVQGFGQSLAYDLQRELKKNGYAALVVRPGEKTPGDLLIRGTIERVAGGNVRHRMSLELFGFGAGEVSVRGEVIDIRTGDSLTAFALTRNAHFSWSENEKAARGTLSEIAQSLARSLFPKKQ